MNTFPPNFGGTSPSEIADDRVGQVWEWADGEVTLVVGRAVDNAIYARPDEALHPTLNLLTGEFSGRFERVDEPWEEDRIWGAKRIA